MNVEATADWHEPPQLRGGHVTLEPLQPVHADGLRDTVNFSIIDAEWPTVKAGLQARLEQHRHG